jgi:hypothetical protein
MGGAKLIGGGFLFFGRLAENARWAGEGVGDWLAGEKISGGL